MEDWHTWRANPLILFSPRNPLVLAFFLNCCRKAFSPVGDKSRGISGPGSRLWPMAFSLLESLCPKEEKEGKNSWAAYG